MVVNKANDEWLNLGVDVLFQHQRPGSPTVTVAISLYNYRRYIAACLDSVRTQTLSDIDLIIVDDSSKDGSEGEALRWLQVHGARFSRALLVRHKANRGLAAARNPAFTLARTAYVFVLDADNLLYPPCLERLAAALDRCDASFAYGYLEKFGEAIGLQNTQPWEPRLFQYGNYIDAMSLIRKKVWEEVGGYSKMGVMGWEDFDLWFKVARMGGWGVQVPEILARYRVHQSSMLHTVANPKADHLWLELYTNYPEFFTDPLIIGGLFLRLQDWGKAAQALEQATLQPQAPAEAWEQLCQAYLQLGEQHRFENALFRYLERYPERAVRVVEHYPKETAILARVIERLVERWPSHPTLLKAWMQVLFRRGCVDQARQVATQARRAQEKRQRQLQAWIAEGQWREAEAGLQAWLAEEGQDFEALRLKASLLLAQGFISEALLLYQRLLPSGQERLDFLEEYLQACLRVGNHKTALKIVEHLLLLPATDERQRLINDLAARWPDFLPLQALALYPPQGSSAMQGASADMDTAVQLLQTLLAAEDVLAALEAHRHQLSAKVLHLVRANAQAARLDGDQELAEGLEALGTFIQEALAEKTV